MRTAWRPAWEEGVLLEETWVPLWMLRRLADRHPNPGPLRRAGMPLPGHIGRACELHGLAIRAKETGWLSGARMTAFLKELERAPQPELPS